MPERGAAVAISAPSIFDGAHFLQDHCVIVRGDTLQGVVPLAECPAGVALTALPDGILAPGLIDLQVNGGGDLMFNNAPCRETLDAMLGAHRATGTTAMMPTLISDTDAAREQAVAAVRAARAAGNSGILGIHLEGPYFEPGRRGAHRADMIRTPTPGDIAWLCALTDLQVILTLAPEHVGPGQIRQLSASGIHVCAGHTNASHARITAAIAQGLQGVTHLFNAMSPLAGREPGTVGAALAEDRLWAGIIADGHHVHPANIRLAQRVKPAGRLVLVSDAMATVGGRNDSFFLYGEQVGVDSGKLVNGDGVLAGSAIGMIDAVGYCARTVGIPLEECLRMASLYPAAILGLDDRLGRIAGGYRADLVHFDADFVVRNTWQAGHHQRHRQY
ncbi:MAG: N-acetylglucosamine-6-phosphate deacetylase [Halieaceae bacterium]|jgi:N-acetylglucosamine-6-phosphate deacetylase|nr:N-acetylglucosamine-6-phosphate deacetylase [Halieaceae bacterium]